MKQLPTQTRLVGCLTGNRGEITHSNAWSGDYQIKWEQLDRPITYTTIELHRMIRQQIIRIDV